MSRIPRTAHCVDCGFTIPLDEQGRFIEHRWDGRVSIRGGCEGCGALPVTTELVEATQEYGRRVVQAMVAHQMREAA